MLNAPSIIKLELVGRPTSALQVLSPRLLQPLCRLHRCKNLVFGDSADWLLFHDVVPITSTVYLKFCALTY